MLQSHTKPLTLRSLLQSYRDHTEGARDRGTSFEKFVIAYLTQDPLQCQEYEKVQTYRDWAREHGWDGTDIGIDLVAKIRDEEGYAAIQCKFYSANHQIKKKILIALLPPLGKLHSRVVFLLIAPKVIGVTMPISLVKDKEFAFNGLIF